MPTRYKRNLIIGKLHKANRIESHFDKVMQRIAGFSSNFINETIRNFKKENIPEWLFEERKIFTVSLPYSSANKKFSILFVK